MPTLELPPRGDGELADGERELRVAWASAIADNARAAAMPMDWNEAFGHVTTIRDLYGMPLIPTGFVRQEPSVVDVVRDRAGFYGVLEALDVGMRFGHDDAFRLSAVQAAELPLVMRRAGFVGCDGMYRTMLGVDPYAPEIASRLVTAYRADAGPEVGWAIETQMRSFDPPSGT